MKNLPFILVALVFVAIFSYFVYAQIHVHATCDGHVVKNTFDWPVCVN